MKGRVTRQWAKKVITISQLEQDSHGEQAGHKDGEKSYQVQRLPAHSWTVPELPGKAKSLPLMNIFP